MSSLLNRLLLIVLIALQPAMAFGIYNEFNLRAVRQKLIENEVLRYLHLVVAEQRRIVEGAEQVLGVLAGAPAIRDTVADECRPLLLSLLANSPRYRFADVTGTDGDTICSPWPLGRSLNAADRPYFQRAMQSGRFAVGDFTVGRYSAEPTIHMAAPFRDQAGAIAGVVEVALSLKWLSQQLERLDLPPGSIVAVSDRNGRFLARFPAQPGIVGALQPPKVLALLAAQQETVVRLTSLDRQRPVLAAFSPPSEANGGFLISVALDEEEAFAGVAQADRTGITLIVAGALLSLLLTASLGTKLIREPVNRLLAVAAEWGRGNLAARSGLANEQGEFGRLAAKFEAMAAALDARDKAMESALESTSDSVIVFDRNWRFSYLNRRAAGLLARYGELPGQVLWAVFPEVEGDFGPALRGAMERRVQTRVGAHFAPLDAELDVTIYPSELGVTVFIRDLTSERRAAAALEATEMQLRLAQQATGFGLWERDYGTGASMWSPEQWRLHGLSPRLGGPSREEHEATMHPDDRSRVVAERSAWLADPSRPFDTDYRVVLPDGAVRWVQWKGHAVRGPSGEVVRTLGLALDVTERRQSEIALRQLSTDLERRVREEVAAREAAQARAAQAGRMQALGQLAGGIAHDFNNVLQGMVGAVRMIARRPDDQARVQRLATLAIEAADRGAAITGRLLAFSRRADLRAEAVDVAALFTGLQELLAHTLGPAIEVKVLVQPGLQPILADKWQLETVLVNLATNARDAMPSGGRVTLSAGNGTEGWPGPRRPAGLPIGRFTYLCVGDTGHGMDAATLARAGEPFFTTKELGAGTGLGLPMAKGFAEQSGGAFQIDSTPGQGTTVSLWLPEYCAAADPALPEPVGQAVDPATGECLGRILVVDDEAMVREVLQHYLQDAGYEVVLAASGAEALAMLDAKLQVDALVSDLSMPDMDGLAVIQAVQERLPGLPSLLLTGYAGEEALLALNGTMSGTFTLLRKPVSDAQLQIRLQALLAA